MSANGLDLSGDWDGMYSYPALLAPVAFAAKVSERDGLLTGFIEDAAVSPAHPCGSASIEGRRLGLGVTFLKRYENRAVQDDVGYDGLVSADGSEISGRWSIVGQWSGPFLMVRRPRKALARTRHAGAQA